MKQRLKRYGLSVGAGLLLLPAFAQATSGFVLKGFLQGMPDSVKVELVTTGIGEGKKETKVIDEALVEHQTFELHGTVQSPELCRLQLKSKHPKTQRYTTMVSVRLMVENTPMTLTSSVSYDSLQKVTYNFDQECLIDLKGGEALKQWAEYRQALHTAEKQERLISYLGAERYFAFNAHPDTVQKYDALKEQAAAALLDASLCFVKEHPDYYISAHWVNEHLNTFYTYTTRQLNEMAGQVAVCPDTALVHRSQRLLSRALQYALGEPYKDVEATAPDGTVKRLSAYVQPGRYLLVDFWASWCGPCRSAIPKVQQLRRQYAGQLEVCSISVDEHEDKWRRAMEDEKMEWAQLWLNDSQATKACTDYVVQSIPRLVLIDAQGKVACISFKPAVIESYLQQHIKTTK